MLSQEKQPKEAKENMRSTTIITKGKEGGVWLTLARKSFESVAGELSLLIVFSPPVLLAENGEKHTALPLCT
jgi:hypothetical protein